MAACGQPTAQPTPPAATAAPAPPATAAPAAAAQPAGGLRLALVPGGSEARYVAREVLAANTFQTDAVGTTRDVGGEILLGPAGQILPGSKITVSLQSLTSDRSQRDQFIKRSTLQTSQHPNAEFVPNEAQGLPSPLPTSGQTSFKLLGSLTVRGVAKPATWDVVATFAGAGVTGKATTVVRLDTFGMQQPQVPLVASIEDDIRLEIDFQATRTS